MPIAIAIRSPIPMVGFAISRNELLCNVLEALRIFAARCSNPEQELDLKDVGY
jgi:hypothetical protein